MRQQLEKAAVLAGLAPPPEPDPPPWLRSLVEAIAADILATDLPEALDALGVIRRGRRRMVHIIRGRLRVLPPRNAVKGMRIRP